VATQLPLQQLLVKVRCLKSERKSASETCWLTVDAVDNS
jgi:hypothetical protein